MPINRRSESPLRIPRADERLTVGRRRVTTGRVRVKTTTKIEPVVVDEALEADDIRIERKRIGRFLDAPLRPRYEAEVLVIPVMEEVLVVTRRLRLVEEVRIHRRHTTRRHRETVPRRRQHVDITRTPADARA